MLTRVIIRMNFVVLGDTAVICQTAEVN